MNFTNVTVLGQSGNPVATVSANSTGPTSSLATPSHPIIYITKDATNSYVISGEMSSIGIFNTTYRIAGEKSAIGSSENLIISTITSDFRSSPTIGYMRASNNTTLNASNATTQLPNPFASPEMITERISNELRRVISEVKNSTVEGQQPVEIMCGLGMTLEDARCHYNSLLPTS
jgi:hypothetical protein